MDQTIQTIIKKIIKRATDLYLKDRSILNIDNEPFDNEYFNKKTGVFIELVDNGETVAAFGNVIPELSLLNNLIFVLISTIESLDEEYMEKLKNNELTIKIWTVNSHLNLKNKSEREKIHGISSGKPGIIINKNDEQTYCYLPSIWKETSDPIYILENLSLNANLNKDDWKENDIDLITFQSDVTIIN